MLQLKNISKSFGEKGSTNYRPVLTQLSFDLNEGDSVVILGPSGSGKTTLLNIIGTLEAPDEGSLRYKGQELMDMPEKKMEQFRNKEIGFIFQLHHLLPQCTLLENIMLPAILEKNKAKKVDTLQRAERLLKKVGIWEHRDKLPGKMSGGECQRAAVVRAMINQPTLLLADEPTGALDSKNAENIANLLMDLNKEEGVTLLMVTHSQELAKKMNTMYTLEDGVLK